MALGAVQGAARALLKHGLLNRAVPGADKAVPGLVVALSVHPAADIVITVLPAARGRQFALSA